MGSASGLDADVEQFIAARQQKLVGVAYLLTRERHAAEDLVQDALVKGYLRWRQIGLPAHPEAYIRRIIVREFLTGRRRKAATEVVLPPEDLPEPGSTLRTAEERLVMWEALGLLTHRQRAVLVLRAYLDLSDDDIADHLACATGTVRSLATRAYSQLREHPGLREMANLEGTADERP